MHSYELLLRNCNRNSLSTLQTLELWSNAIMTNAPADIIAFTLEGAPITLADVNEHTQEAIKNCPVDCDMLINDDGSIPTTQINARTSLENIAEEIAVARTKMVPAKVARSINTAKEMIREGHALLNIEERELRKCISTLYTLTDFSAHLEANKKIAEQREQIRQLAELEAQVADLKRKLRVP